MVTNKKLIYLGASGQSIAQCSEKKNSLTKELDFYKNAVKQSNDIMDQLEGISDSFLKMTEQLDNIFNAPQQYFASEDEAKLYFDHVSNLSAKYESNEDLNKRIVNLYIRLIVDDGIYKKRLNELQQSYNTLQDYIDNVEKLGQIPSAITDSSDKEFTNINNQLSSYKKEVMSLFNSITNLATDLKIIKFSYKPIDHASTDILTIYRKIYDNVKTEYNKMSDDNDDNDYIDGTAYKTFEPNSYYVSDEDPVLNGTVSDEIANALTNENVNDVETLQRVLSETDFNEAGYILNNIDDGYKNSSYSYSYNHNSTTPFVPDNGEYYGSGSGYDSENDDTSYNDSPLEPYDEEDYGSGSGSGSGNGN